MVDRHSPESLLRRHGLRMTPQRLAVAELMLAQPLHRTPKQIYAELKPRHPSLSPNTVYLTVEQFEQAGLLRRIHIDGRTYFDSRTERHDHAYCHRCGAIQDLPASSQDQTPLTLKRWQVDSESRIWFGLCPECCGKSSQEAG